MEQYINKSALVAEIERRRRDWRYGSSIEAKFKREEYDDILSFLDTLETKEVDLEKDVNEIIKTAEDHAYFAGSENTRKNLWHPTNGDDLPEIDREVIVLLSNNKVCFAHRPQEYWDGKNIATEEITRYYPKRYDKGGWNQPDVKWWLDLDLPKTEE